MDSPDSPDGNLLDWDEELVCFWLDKNGFASHQDAIREHGITGDVLALLSSDDMRDLGISSLGHRLGILKLVYQLKIRQGIPLEEGCWLPAQDESVEAGPDETSFSSSILGNGFASAHGADAERIWEMLQEQSQRILQLEQEYEKLNEAFHLHQDELNSAQRAISRAQSHPQSNTPEPSQPLRKQPSFKWANFGRHLRSPTQPTPSEQTPLPAPPVLIDPRPPSDGKPSPPKREDLALSATNSPPKQKLALGRSQSLNKHTSPSRRNPPLPLLDGLPAVPATPAAPPPSSFPHSTSLNNLNNTPSHIESSSSLTRSATSVSPQTSIRPAPPVRYVSSSKLTTSASTSPVPVSTLPLPSAPPTASTLSAASNDSTSLAPSTHLPRTSSGHLTPPNASTSTLAPSPNGGLSEKGGRGRETPSPSGKEKGSTDNPQKFRVTIDDPCWKVLPAALKKYKIIDDWRMYALFICYGSSSTSTGTERCLSYDEKPLLLFQKLKEANQAPVFMLRHIRDIKSPIAIAQNKQAAKLSASTSSSSLNNASNPPSSSSSLSTNLSSSTSTSAFGASSSTTTTPSSSSQLSSSTPLLTNKVQLPAQPSNPHPPARNTLSPKAQSGSAADGLQALEKPVTDGGAGGIGMTESGQGSGSGSGGAGANDGARGETGGVTEVNYAISIYPYFAEREDEFDVVVDDTFIILSKAKGWWVVQRDPTGQGLVCPDSSKAGWVPAGCLLECNRPPGPKTLPPSSAHSGPNTSSSSTPSSTTTRLPTSFSTSSSALFKSSTRGAMTAAYVPLPSIVSTSYPGIALMDFTGTADNEMTLRKGEHLKVYKRYIHWSYASTERGERGWCPSWYIGRLQSSTTPAAGGPSLTTQAVPQTPMTSVPTPSAAASTVSGSVGTEIDVS